MKYIQKLGLLSVVTISLLISCSEIDNRANLANQKLINEIDSLSNHLCKFTDFKKIDAIEGAKIYNLSFEGFISAQKDCLFDTRDEEGYIDQVKATLKAVTSSKDTSHPHFLSANSNYGYPIKGGATFVKKDSGWNLVDWSYTFSSKK